MLTVVHFLWFNPNERRNKNYVYDCHSVNRAKRAISANLKVPHRFVVVSDRSEGFDPDIRVVPLDMSKFPPRGRYPKLMIFRHDAAELFGERMLMVDLDVCVAGDITPLVERDEDIVLWDGNPDPRFAKKGHPRYNTSIVLLRAGSRPHVWDRFDPKTTPALVHAEGKDGSDQVWVSKLLPDEATWDGHTDGIYLAREVGSDLPANARLVFFPGRENPALKSTRRRYQWVTKRLIVSA
jgi:hypothetical protein